MEKVLITLCGRAGSKGFRNKNLKMFDGLPLSYYSLAGGPRALSSRIPECLWIFV